MQGHRTQVPALCIIVKPVTDFVSPMTAAFPFAVYKSDLDARLF